LRRMDRKSIQKLKVSFCLVAVIIIFCLAPGCMEEKMDNAPADNDGNNGEERPSIESVVIREQYFEMELALTPKQRTQGLMGRENLADNRGMLFVFPAYDPYPTELNFWMKNCLMPIDVIFLDRGGIVTAIYEMEPPDPNISDEEQPVYPSKGPAQFAIELRGGRAAELGLQVGDIIDLRKDFLLQWAE